MGENWTTLHILFLLLRKVNRLAPLFCSSGVQGGSLLWGGRKWIFWGRCYSKQSYLPLPHYQLIRLDTKTFFASQKSEPPCTPFFVLLRKVNRLAPPLNPFKTVLLSPPLHHLPAYDTCLKKLFFWLLRKVNCLTPFFWLLTKVNRLAPPLNPFKTVLLPPPNTSL